MINIRAEIVFLFRIGGFTIFDMYAYDNFVVVYTDPVYK